MRASYGLLLCMCAALTACNMALSEKPLFAERSSTIRLSDGLWAGSDPKCTVDLSSPKQQWPKCAGWFVLENSKVVAGSDMKSDEGAQDVFVVDGKPPLVQAVIKMSGPERSEFYYGYFILEPKDRSSDGRRAEWRRPTAISPRILASTKTAKPRRCPRFERPRQDHRGPVWSRCL